MPPSGDSGCRRWVNVHFPFGYHPEAAELGLHGRAGRRPQFAEGELDFRE